MKTKKNTELSTDWLQVCVLQKFNCRPLTGPLTPNLPNPTHEANIYTVVLLITTDTERKYVQT